MKSITWIPIITIIGFFASANYSQLAAQSSGDYISSYVGAVNNIRNQANQYVEVIAEGVRGLGSRRNQSARKFMLKDTKRVIGAVLEALDKLTPPEELKIYHTKIVDMYVFHNLANSALMEDNPDAAKRLFRQGALSFIQAQQELKKVFTDLGAPRSFIDDLDASIKKEYEAVKEMY